MDGRMDGWMDACMDGEVLIIGMIVGWSGGVPKGLPCGEKRPCSVGTGALRKRFVFERAFGAIFSVFWWILDGIRT